MNPLDKFEISIRRKSDKVTAAVPQLGLYATAADNHAALDALERKKVELLEDLTAAGEVEFTCSREPSAPASACGSGDSH